MVTTKMSKDNRCETNRSLPCKEIEKETSDYSISIDNSYHVSLTILVSF